MFHSILSNIYKNVLSVQRTLSIGNQAVKILDYCTDSVKIAVVSKHDLKIVVYPENFNPKLLIVLDVIFLIFFFIKINIIDRKLIEHFPDGGTI